MKAEVWWKQITSAERFLRDIVKALLEGKSVILYGTEKMPWIHVMRSLVTDGVKTQSSNRAIYPLTAAEGGEKLGEFLLKHFCKPELRTKYRPIMSPAKFLADCEDSTLPSSYIWVQSANLDETRRWTDFIGDYVDAVGKRRGAVFLLEAAEGAEELQKKGIASFSYEKAINPYDRFVFNMLLASEINVGSSYMKEYLAELASNVTDGDIELSAECIERGKEFLADPCGILKAVREKVGLDAPNATEEIVQHAAWVAQIKQVFPLIEDYRQKFIADHEKMIQGSLPWTASDGSPVEEPKDAELGLLWFLSQKDHWLLSPTAKEKLKLFREARNTIAHMGLLDLDEMQELFDMYGRNG